MSTATKKQLLAQIADLNDEQIRDALNTMTMNLNANKTTVLRDLQDAIDHLVPATVVKHEDRDKDKNKLNKKKNKSSKKRLRADSDDSEHDEPLPKKAKKSKKKKKRTESSASKSQSTGGSTNSETPIAEKKEPKRKGKPNAQNISRPNDSIIDVANQQAVQKESQKPSVKGNTSNNVPASKVKKNHETASMRCNVSGCHDTNCRHDRRRRVSCTPNKTQAPRGPRRRGPSISQISHRGNGYGIDGVPPSTPKAPAAMVNHTTAPNRGAQHPNFQQRGAAQQGHQERSHQQYNNRQPNPGHPYSHHPHQDRQRWHTQGSDRQQQQPQTPLTPESSRSSSRDRRAIHTHIKFGTPPPMIKTEPGLDDELQILSSPPLPFKQHPVEQNCHPKFPGHSGVRGVEAASASRVSFSVTL